MPSKDQPVRAGYHKDDRPREALGLERFAEPGEGKPTVRLPSLKNLVPRTLGQQFGAIISLLLLATIGISTWHTAATQSAKLTNALRGEALIVARNIAALSANALLVEDYASIETLLARNAEFPNLLSVSVTSPDGAVLSRVEKAADGIPRPAFGAKRMAPPPDPAGTILVTPDRITVWHPVIEKSLFGWVRVEYSLAAIGEVRRRIWRDAAAAGLVVIAVSVALILAFLNRHVRDVRQVTAFAQKLDELKGSKLPVVNSSLEMEQLVDAMNQASWRLVEQERARRASEDRYRDLFEESKDVVFVSTPSGGIIDVNPAGVDLFGAASRDEMLSINVARDLYVNPADRQRFQWQMEHRGFIKDFEASMKRRNGDVLSVLITAGAVRDASGAITAYRGILRDVTAERKLEQQLRHAQKLEAVGQLTGGIAHDFNNILTAIIGYAHILESKMSADSPLRNFASQILSTAERAAHLTRSLLAFSRKQVMTLRPVVLNDVVGSVEKLLQHLMGDDVRLVTRLTSDSLTVRADSGQIEQVLMNLATNARDAMPQGGRVEIETQRVELDAAFRRAHGYGEPGPYGLISVSDTGRGMDSETVKKIFEPFFTTKDVGKGTGLGLSIVYGIVKQHNGYINVYSEPGRGTTFKIYLPLIAADENATAAADTALPRGGQETILLAEDDEAVRMLMRTVLGEAGYRLIEATDGDDAITKFTGHRDGVDLVILDVIMPKKNGREVLEAIRAVRPDVRAVFMSGYTSSIIRSRGVLDADAPLLTKPLSPNVLLKAVRDLLDAPAR